MRLRRVEIERFRGIKELRWDLAGDFICLIGPGDSTKTTILDAIELALSPRWNIVFDDADFHNANTELPLIITVTVGDLPEELKGNAKFGLSARGWTPAGELHDEPEEGDELVLSIRLHVGSSLEPTWAVVNDREDEGRQIRGRDRGRLGCARLGTFLDRHFAWGRGSALSRLTGDDDGLGDILAGAARAARIALAESDPQKLAELRFAAESAQKVGAEFGVAPKEKYHPRLDVQSVSVGAGGLSLHDGEVPVRRAGLGTRRLLAVAMQREVAKKGGLMLIDEVEHGLEPHRIRHLLRVLQGTDASPLARHVLMTTHAPVVLEELKAEQLGVVRSVNGRTEVLPVPNELQRVVRKASEAFLARKVLVCEGRTELGFCRYLDQSWSEAGPSFGLLGVALADGGGNEAAGVALAFSRLRYEVAFLGDSDKPIKPNAKTLEENNAKVFIWEGGVCIEQRIALDLPWEGIVEIVREAMNEHGKTSVRDAVKYHLNGAWADLLDDPSDWSDGVDEVSLRDAIGLAAKGSKNRKAWFKRVDLAEGLGKIILQHTSAIQDTPLWRTIDVLRTWAHAN